MFHKIVVENIQEKAFSTAPVLLFSSLLFHHWLNVLPDPTSLTRHISQSATVLKRKKLTSHIQDF